MNAEHVRSREQQAQRSQEREMLLHRLLPFAVVMGFIIGSVLVAIFTHNAWGGVAGIGVTAGAVLTAYLKAPAARSAPSAPVSGSAIVGPAKNP